MWETRGYPFRSVYQFGFQDGLEGAGVAQAGVRDRLDARDAYARLVVGVPHVGDEAFARHIAITEISA